MCFYYRVLHFAPRYSDNLSIKFYNFKQGLAYLLLSYAINFSLRCLKQKLEVIHTIYMTNNPKEGSYLKQSKLCISFKASLKKRVSCAASAPAIFSIISLVFIYTFRDFIWCVFYCYFLGDRGRIIGSYFVVPLKFTTEMPERKTRFDKIEQTLPAFLDN